MWVPPTQGHSWRERRRRGLVQSLLLGSWLGWGRGRKTWRGAHQTQVNSTTLF